MYINSYLVWWAFEVPPGQNTHQRRFNLCSLCMSPISDQPPSLWYSLSLRYAKVMAQSCNPLLDTIVSVGSHSPTVKLCLVGKLTNQIKCLNSCLPHGMSREAARRNGKERSGKRKLEIEVSNPHACGADAFFPKDSTIHSMPHLLFLPRRVLFPPCPALDSLEKLFRCIRDGLDGGEDFPQVLCSTKLIV